MNLTVKEVKRLKNPNSLADTIYNNFIYLSDVPQLQHNKQEISRLLTCDEMDGLLVFHENKLIAYLIGEIKVIQDGRYVYYISYVYVTPNFRKHKIGTKLLYLIENKCSKMGVKFILLTCDSNDKPAFNFYLKNRFVHDPVLKSNTSHQVLIKYLS